MDKTINHKFAPNETVLAIIKKYNKYPQDNQQLEYLRLRFYEINGSKVFTAGDKVQIPLLEEQS